ncbi:DNA cytosine methyltransferase [Formosa haliotis]|uniref:DNA cytosine methyltransferase n=1 Tax=Formosa haliotis TaxID=1555194 RepID=UPI000825ECD7|nr:DNA cytosine methyltransferase [Formosa haliotis]
MISVKTASERLNISPQQVRNLCRSGKLKSEKLGNAWVIEESNLEYYFDTTCSGVAEDQAKYETKKQSKDTPIALSFFSGAMGLDIGLEKAGFKTIFASEINNACRKTILKNNPEINLIGDILDYSPQEIKKISGLTENDDIDLIVGGPPCQAFSTAGKRKGFEDKRGNVFLTFIDIIIALRPKYAVIENVRGLLSAPLKHRPHKSRGDEFEELTADELPGGALNHIINKLRESGYATSFNLYNSANFGTPQKRERIVIICSRNGEKPPFLEPTHSEHGINNLPKWRTFKDAVSRLSDSNHDYINFPEKRLKYYRMINEGKNWRSLPIETQKEAMGASFYSGGGKTGFLRRLAWDKPSPTLLTHPAMPATDLCHPIENRPLSIQEYKAIQEFPEDWQIEGSILEQYKQIGNAVPVGLGFAVGKLLVKLIRGQKIENFKDFKFSRYLNTDDKSWQQNFNKQRKKTNSYTLEL